MLEERIRSSGESRDAWAAKLGISAAYLSQLCTGRRRPSLEVAVAISRATGGAVPVESWVEPGARLPSSTEAA